jgi:uncharacterized protein (TIGR00369 family)
MIAFLAALSPSAIASSERNVIRELWDRVHALPGGKKLFTKAIGLAAPYTGTIGAEVEKLSRGHAEVTLRDRRAVRNHLECVHAIALCNLAELAGNVALAYSLPDDARFIVAGLSIEYHKKARGTLRAVVDCPTPETSERKEYPVVVHIFDPKGEEVATSTLRTLVGPKRK